MIQAAPAITEARRPAATRCRLLGVEPGSPLARSLGPAVAAGGAAPAVPGLWRRLVRGSALAWFADAPAAPVEPAPGGEILIDPWGLPPPASAGRYWRLVDGTGRPLLAPYAGLEPLGRGVASLHLIEAAGEGWRLLAEAHIGTRLGYRALLDRLAALAGRLVEAGLRGTAGGTPAPSQPAAAAHGSLWAIGALLRSGLRRLGTRWHDRLTVESWGIGIVPQPASAPLPPPTLATAAWLRAPDSRDYLADPFPWPGRPDRVLCELFDGRSGRGVLASARRDGLRLGGLERLPVEIAGHASYPMAWAEGDTVYCLPETGARRRAVLYRLPAEGPLEELVVLGEDVNFADPTIFRLNGLYWLWYTDADLGPHDNLCLRYAERLEGPWQAHPMNPVKLDVRSSRPGGTPFLVGGVLYRPAQDCSTWYGGALALNQVLVCTPERYEERVVRVYRPDPAGPYPHGLHTMSLGEGEILIDGKRFVPSPGAFLRRALARLARR